MPTIIAVDDIPAELSAEQVARLGQLLAGLFLLHAATGATDDAGEARPAPVVAKEPMEVTA